MAPKRRKSGGAKIEDVDAAGEEATGAKVAKIEPMMTPQDAVGRVLRGETPRLALPEASVASSFVAAASFLSQFRIFVPLAAVSA